MTIEEIDNKIYFLESAVRSIKMWINSAYPLINPSTLPACNQLDKVISRRLKYKYRILELKIQKKRLQKLTRILNED
jgi:hypothetical protein